MAWERRSEPLSGYPDRVVGTRRVRGAFAVRDIEELERLMKTAFYAFIIGASLLLNACATVKGLGRDIESVGEAGSDVIDG